MLGLDSPSSEVKPRLSRTDFIAAAARLGCEPAMIAAVVEVESPRGGFNPDGTLTTLFEAHHFHRYTRARFAQSHPTLSSPRWDRTLYGRGWRAERQRLAMAASLDSTAALLSTSWGMFQIMGFNHANCGFRTPQEMVSAFSAGEPAQLAAFLTFIEIRGLADELRDKRLLEFALSYNGPRARENKYDTKLANAYARKLTEFA